MGARQIREADRTARLVQRASQGVGAARGERVRARVLVRSLRLWLAAGQSPAATAKLITVLQELEDSL